MTQAYSRPPCPSELVKVDLMRYLSDWGRNVSQTILASLVENEEDSPYALIRNVEIPL